MSPHYYGPTEWSGGREYDYGYYGDDDGTPTDRWQFVRTIAGSYEYHMRARLDLRVYGKGMPNGRCYAKHAALYLRTGMSEITIGHFRCSSVTEAKNRADAFNIVAHLDWLRRNDYAKESAQTVFRVTAEGAYVPHVTLLRAMWHDTRCLGLGRYEAFDWRGTAAGEKTIAHSDIEISGWSQCSTGTTRDPNDVPLVVMDHLPFKTQAEWQAARTAREESRPKPLATITKKPSRKTSAKENAS